jgi:hypothetical protein
VAGEVDGEDAMTESLEARDDELPAPGAMTGAVDEDVVARTPLSRL